jgi:hypothetical protein
MGGIGAVLDDELARARGAAGAGRSVVLVEGASDRGAIETLAHRQGRDLDDEGVVVVAMAGATNIGRFLRLLGPSGHDVAMAGLCDAAEEPGVRGALERSGLGTALNRASMERLGFFVCVDDLEQELIRALGAPAVLALMAAHGDAQRFQRFRNQPAQRGRTLERQIWRWLGNHKIRYAPALVTALDLAAVPAPLAGVLAHVTHR